MGKWTALFFHSPYRSHAEEPAEDGRLVGKEKILGFESQNIM